MNSKGEILKDVGHTDFNKISDELDYNKKANLDDSFEKRNKEIPKKIVDEDEGKIAYQEIQPGTPIYYNDRINVLDDLESMKMRSWEKTKEYMLKLFSKTNDLFFISHKEDEIIGKPERIFNVKQKIILVTKARKPIKNQMLEDSWKERNIFLDEKYDKRYDGAEHKILGFHFWIYRVIEKGIEYIALSEKELNPQQHRLRGMEIILKDLSELTKTLKIKTVSNLFLIVEDEPSIKPIDKNELIDYFKNLNLSEEEFIDYLYTHPIDNKIYSHTEDYSRIRVYQELSGKYEGYPLHLMIWGAVGRGKTCELECINAKFNEEKGIFEAGNSTLKGLIPSYSEKPANMGHILKCLRRSLIDEVNKMFNKTQNYEVVKDYLSQLNFILEHKDREVGSGNNNDFRTQATAKVTLATNGFGHRAFLHEHIGIVDSTTLSRILHLVVDGKEYEFMKNNRIKKNRVEKINNNQFLTIYDSCQNFLVNYDEEKIREIFELSLEDTGEFKEIWKARGLHHTILLLDGIVKFRCLFAEDKSFKSKPEDYEKLKSVLNYLIESWGYPLKK